jgi:hypothetical protein
MSDEATGRADEDPEFRRLLHAQWLERRNRRQSDAAYRDEWWAAQCGGCRLSLELAGPVGLDYGACANAGSPFFGQVRFEHDGCDAFIAGGPWHDAPAISLHADDVET